MHITDILQKNHTSLSFEFFPPNHSEGQDLLKETLLRLARYEPDFVSMTYAAGGSTREATKRCVAQVKNQVGLECIPHLTCVNHQREEIDEILIHYSKMGISNLLALRGDVPRDRPLHDHNSDFCVHAVDLVKHIQRFNHSRALPNSAGFGIGVAGFPEGHPGTPNRWVEMDHLKAKVDAGADFICTQLFFDNHDFFDFRERCELAGIKVPILAGIMPITSIRGLYRMVELSGRARVPARFLKALYRVKNDPAAVAQVGIHHATEQAADLWHHQVAGIHFYTLNQADTIEEILKRMGISPRVIVSSEDR